MQMTEAFASAVAVSVPIFALAAGAEARGIRERLRRPDQEWENHFAAYRAEHEHGLEGRPDEVFRYFRGMPGLSRLYLAERAVAIGSALAWLVIFVLLGITELRCLVWLGDGQPAGASGLATFSLVVIGLSMLALILGPTLYLLVPLLLPLDVIPKGMKEEVGSKLVNKRGRNFVKLVFSELESALDRAADKYDEAQEAQAGEATRAEPVPAGDPPGGNGQSGETGPVG
ncbi:MAG TPA: hypothetical protein VHY31_08860 [Streptosporangiaceae bacterium]|jgi:hypothetical protein|nr:hypothetical protein [Streptosporangiaceae bacterium]